MNDEAPVYIGPDTTAQEEGYRVILEQDYETIALNETSVQKLLEYLREKGWNV